LYKADAANVATNALATYASNAARWRQAVRYGRRRHDLPLAMMGDSPAVTDSAWPASR
jgi:uncharacterized membrane protein